MPPHHHDQVQALIDGNEKYASTFQGWPTIKDIRGSFTAEDRAVCILTCVDFRTVPEEFFSFGGGQHPVIRTPGGRAADAMRSIVTLDTLLPIGTLVIVHHTDCALSNVSNAEIRAHVEQIRGPQGDALANMDFGEIKNKDFEKSIREEIAYVKSYPYSNPNMEVQGFILDLKNGKVRKVDA